MKFPILILLFLIPSFCFTQTAKQYLELGIKKNMEYDSESALQYFDKAIALDRKLYSAYWNRGSTKWSLFDYKGAMEDLNTAIEIDPSIEVAYVDRARTKISLNDYRGAIKDYDIAIRLRPNISTYFFLRAEAKDQLKEFLSAIADYDKSITLNPIKSLRGESYLKRGIDKLRVSKKNEGCMDLSKAGELGETKAYDYIRKYCQ